MPHSPQFLALVDEVRPSIREVPACAVPGLLAEGAVLVDVREQSEYDESHVVGARWLGKGVLERDIVDVFPDPATELLLYCGSGLRSALAADAATRMGYVNVRSVEGGITALSGCLPLT